jgi:ASCH domain
LRDIILLPKLIHTSLVKEPRISMAKCLSIRQPYAELVVSGRKTIELRKWITRFRGEFLVHAYIYLDTTPKIDCPSIILRMSRCPVSVILVSSISIPSMART